MQKLLGWKWTIRIQIDEKILRPIIFVIQETCGPIHHINQFQFSCVLEKELYSKLHRPSIFQTIYIGFIHAFVYESMTFKDIQLKV
jgi:hypothetical protein